MLGILTVAELLGMTLWFAASAVSAQYTAQWTLSSSDAAWLTTIVQLGFVAGTLLASYWHGLRRLFTGSREIDAEVQRSVNQIYAQRGIGDVFLSWENEAFLVLKEFGADKFEIVVPSLSILAEPTISVVDRVVKKKGTAEVAKAYLDYLYTDEGQEIAARNYYRPRNQAIAAKYPGNFAKLELFTIDAAFGGWAQAQKVHFADGGTFDQIYAK